MEYGIVSYIAFKVFIPVTKTSIILQRVGSKLNDNVPAGPTVSNKPSRLKANNILASS